MLMTEVRDIARKYELKTSRLTKANLIRQIQVAEGNYDCFATPEVNTCNQLGCLWREDCLAAAK